MSGAIPALANTSLAPGGLIKIEHNFQSCNHSVTASNVIYFYILQFKKHPGNNSERVHECQQQVGCVILHLCVFASSQDGCAPQTRSNPFCSVTLPG